LEDVPKTKRAFEEELTNVKQYLGSANSQIESHNAQIRSVIVGALQQRCDQLRAGKQNIDALGYPTRPRVPQVRVSTSTSEAQPARTEPVRKAVKQVSPEYDVALSFAGEDREYVEQVAEILKASGVK